MRLEAPNTSICLELPFGTKSDHFHFKSSRMVFLKPGCTLAKAVKLVYYPSELMENP